MQHHEHHSVGSNALSLVFPLLLIALVLGFYIAGVIILQKRNQNWYKWRTLSFSSGILLLFIAMLPSMVQFGHQDIRGHMVQHLLIGMLAPLGLVLGAPVTLALRVLPKRIAQRITWVLSSSFFHFISHPVTALLLNIGGMYVLYLTPLYNATFTSPVLHHFIHIHFLLAGYLFTWAIAGPDPAPRRPHYKVRVMVLFFSIAAHAYLSKFMYAYLYPLNSPHGADEIREASQIMYYGGDFSELLLTIVFFSVWYQKRAHPKHQNEILFT